MPRSLLLILLSLTFGAPAAAQERELPPPPAVVDDGSAVVEELEVIARPLGPPLWVARKGGAELVVIGTVGALPKGQDWHRRRVERALDGADALIIPPTVSVGPIGVATLLFRDFRRLRQPKGRTLQQQLPPALWRRLVSYADSDDPTGDDFQSWRAPTAGMLAQAEAGERAGLDRNEPARTLKALAKGKRVPVRPSATVSAGAVAGGVASLSPEREVACLEAMLDLADAAPSQRRQGEAWTRGDLATLRLTLADPARVAFVDRCAVKGTRLGVVASSALERSTVLLEKELERPGKRVALVDIRLLLARNGVLDRLKARGAEISAPPD